MLPRRLALLVFSVPVECSGVRIAEMFGKPVAMAIKMLALMVPLPALRLLLEGFQVFLREVLKVSNGVFLHSCFRQPGREMIAG